MQTIGLATLLNRSGHSDIHSSLSHFGMSRAPRPSSTTTLARRHRELAMARTFTAVCLCEGSGPVRTIGWTCRSRPGRTYWRKSSGRTTCATKHFCGGSLAIGISSLEERNWAVHHRTTDLWHPCRCPSRYKQFLIHTCSLLSVHLMLHVIYVSLPPPILPHLFVFNP